MIDHHTYAHSCEIKGWKKINNGIQTHDLQDTGAMLYQLTYQAIGQFVSSEYTLVFVTICRYISNSQSDQLPDGLVGQLVEHCTGTAEVMDSNLDC